MQIGCGEDSFRPPAALAVLSCSPQASGLFCFALDRPERECLLSSFQVICEFVPWSWQTLCVTRRHGPKILNHNGSSSMVNARSVSEDVFRKNSCCNSVRAAAIHSHCAARFCWTLDPLTGNFFCASIVFLKKVACVREVLRCNLLHCIVIA